MPSVFDSFAGLPLSIDMSGAGCASHQLKDSFHDKWQAKTNDYFHHASRVDWAKLATVVGSNTQSLSLTNRNQEMSQPITDLV